VDGESGIFVSSNQGKLNLMRLAYYPESMSYHHNPKTFLALRAFNEGSKNQHDASIKQ
jgi:hypothetical protein